MINYYTLLITFVVIVDVDVIIIIILQWVSPSIIGSHSDYVAANSYTERCLV